MRVLRSAMALVCSKYLIVGLGSCVTVAANFFIEKGMRLEIFSKILGLNCFQSTVKGFYRIFHQQAAQCS